MTAAPSTLADVVQALFRHPDLPAHTRSDLMSGVRCFCKVLGLDPTATDAGDLSALQAHLARAVPERFRLSPARWGVIRSQFLRALEITGAAKPLRTAAVPLSGAWKQFIAALPAKGQRLALSRFARFCSLRGIGPAAVEQDTFVQFEHALKAGSLIRQPDSVCRAALKAWAELPEGLGGGSAVRIAVPPILPTGRPGRKPLTAFPKSLRHDLEAFTNWCVAEDPLVEGARPKALRRQTVISYKSNLHTAADAAVRSGVPIDDVSAIGVLTRPEIYRAILRQLLTDTGQKATANVHGVATVVLIIAKDWLKLPPERLAELKRLKSKLPKLRPGLTQKNRDLLATFEDRVLLGRFLSLGDELWREALSDLAPKGQRLVRAQTALLIGILQIMPLRRRSICGVMFGRHITWPNGPRSEALLDIPAAEIKTHVDYAGEIPLDLSRRLHHYQTKLVPALTGMTPSHLFIRADGKPKEEVSVVDRLVVTLRKRLGIHMTAHQFRHLGGKLMLDANPGAYEAVAQLLGHTGTKNVVRFYGGADTRRASRHHAALIEKLRQDAKGRVPRRRRT